MTNLTEKEQCKRGCTWWGAGIGLGAALLFWAIFGWGFFLSVILGIVFGVVAFFVLSNIWCDKISDAPVASAAAPSSAASSGAAATASATAAPEAPVASAAPAAQASADVAPAPSEAAASAPDAAAAAPEKAAFSGMKPSTPLKGQQELAARMGTYKYEAPKAEKAPAKKTAAPKKAVASGKAVAAAPEKAAPVKKTAAPKKAAAPKQKAAPKKTAAAPVAPAAFVDVPADTVQSQPETLTQARAGGADDLKRISGVGPKLEQTLNELGFYHFDQIANWGAQEIAWVDARVRFKGRIARDNWMEQAKILAAGGETEFSARTKKT